MTPDGERCCNQAPDFAKDACWNKPPGGDWTWIPAAPPPPPPTASHCPIPEGNLVPLEGGSPEYHDRHYAVTQALGPLPGLTPPQKLKAFAEEFTKRYGICAFAGTEAVFIKRSDDTWDEYHSVAFGNGRWTNSGRGKWIGRHDDKRRTAEGLRMPDPRGERMKFNISPHNGNIDTTLTVFAALEYCQAIRMGKHGDLPRAACPVRPEGHPEREALERAIIGDQVHTCNGEPMEYFRSNPAVAKGGCRGTFRTCTQDGNVCTQKEFD